MQYDPAELWNEDYDTGERPRRGSRTCPTCKRPNVLSSYEAARGYQCRGCTAHDEGPC